MASLSYKIEAYLGRTVNFNTVGGEVLLQNDSDGKGDYIKYWSDSIEKSKPTDAQLDALESEADDYEYNLSQIAKRKAEYGSLEQQMENIMENGVTAEKSRVQSIKEKYPKR